METGEVDIAGIRIHAATCVRDLAGYDEHLIHVRDIGDDMGIARILYPVLGGDALARVKIHIFGAGYIKLIIMPTARKRTHEEMREAARAWMYGFSGKVFLPKEKKATYPYKWGCVVFAENGEIRIYIKYREKERKEP